MHLPLRALLPLLLLMTACELPEDTSTSASTGHEAVTVLSYEEPQPAWGAFTAGEIALPEGTWPTGLAVDGDLLIVADIRSGDLLELELATGELLERRPSGGSFPAGLARDGDLLYATDLFEDRVERHLPRSGRQQAPLPYHQTWPWAVAAGQGRLFVLNARQRQVVVVDPVDGSEERSFPVPGRRPTGLAFDGEYLWSADADSRQLFMIEPETGWVLHRLPSPAVFPSGLAVHDGELLVSDLQAGRVVVVRRFAEAPFVEDLVERYRIDFRVDLAARGSGEVVDARTAIAIPETRPGQRVLDVRFDPEPTSIVTEPSGQRLALFELASLPGGERSRASMSVDVDVARVMFQLDPEAVAELPAIAPNELVQALQDGRKYDLDDEVITGRVKEMLDEETRPYHRARVIYEALADSITYDRSGGWGPAPTVLERGTGSCSEYTFSLVALLRAAGIPARYVGAIVNRAPQGGVDFVYHRWAEVWLGEPWGWVPVDANHGASERPEVRGEGFGSMAGRFLVTTVSYGESEYLDWGYNFGVDHELVGDAELVVRDLAVWTRVEFPTGSADSAR